MTEVKKKKKTVTAPVKVDHTKESNAEIAKVTPKVTPEEEKMSTFAKLRSSHKFRMGFILVLMAITAILFIFWTKARIALAIAFIALLAAFGLEASQNDFDLGKLMQTKSLQESKVSRDTQGNILYDKAGNITTDKNVGKKVDEYNCDDFTSQPQAQSFFMKVGGIRKDTNRLDGDKDGNACESLPKGSN